MSSRFNRNNLLAALFLIGSLALGVVMSFTLRRGSGFEGEPLPFTVRFTLAQGATGLKAGSPVRLGGQQVGSVTSIEIAKGDPLPGSSGSAPAAIPTGIDIHVEVRGDLALYENALVLLELPLLGNLSSINIGSVGDPSAKAQGGSSLIESHEVVKGVVAPPAFLAQAGFGPDQVGQLRQAIASFSGAVERGSALLDKLSPQAEAAAADIAKLLADLRTDLDGWSTKLDTIMANTETASGRLDPILVKVDQIATDASAAAAEFNRLIVENREHIDAVIASIKSAADKLDSTTVDRINTALETGSAALESVGDNAMQLSTLMTSETPNLRRILANLRLMSDQLKLTAIEVRSQPWRLLIQPTTKEFESQVLYDATRAYATAASDLRSASEALDALLNRGNLATDRDREAIVNISERLKEAMANYRKAEQGLLDQLIEQSK